MTGPRRSQRLSARKAAIVVAREAPLPLRAESVQFSDRVSLPPVSVRADESSLSPGALQNFAEALVECRLVQPSFTVNSESYETIESSVAADDGVSAAVHWVGQTQLERSARLRAASLKRERKVQEHIEEEAKQASVEPKKKKRRVLLQEDYVPAKADVVDLGDHMIDENENDRNLNDTVDVDAVLVGAHDSDDLVRSRFSELCASLRQKFDNQESFLSQAWFDGDARKLATCATAVLRRRVAHSLGEKACADFVTVCTESLKLATKLDAQKQAESVAAAANFAVALSSFCAAPEQEVRPSMRGNVASVAVFVLAQMRSCVLANADQGRAEQAETNAALAASLSSLASCTSVLDAETALAPLTEVCMETLRRASLSQSLHLPARALLTAVFADTHVAAAVARADLELPDLDDDRAADAWRSYLLKEVTHDAVTDTVDTVLHVLQAALTHLLDRPRGRPPIAAVLSLLPRVQQLQTKAVTHFVSAVCLPTSLEKEDRGEPKKLREFVRVLFARAQSLLTPIAPMMLSIVLRVTQQVLSGSFDVTVADGALDKKRRTAVKRMRIVALQTLGDALEQMSVWRQNAESLLPTDFLKQERTLSRLLNVATSKLPKNSRFAWTSVLLIHDLAELRNAKKAQNRLWRRISRLRADRPPVSERTASDSECESAEEEYAQTAELSSALMWRQLCRDGTVSDGVTDTVSDTVSDDATDGVTETVQRWTRVNAVTWHRRHVLLRWLLHALRDKSPQFRCQALKIIGSTAKEDVRVLSLETVRTAVQAGCCDSSNSVRDAALDVLALLHLRQDASLSLLQQCKLWQQFWPTLATCAVDQGLAVRRKVVALLKRLLTFVKDTSLQHAQLSCKSEILEERLAFAEHALQLRAALEWLAVRAGTCLLRLATGAITPDLARADVRADTWTSAWTPPRTYMIDADDSSLRTVATNALRHAFFGAKKSKMREDTEREVFVRKLFVPIAASLRAVSESESDGGDDDESLRCLALLQKLVREAGDAEFGASTVKSAITQLDATLTDRAQLCRAVLPLLRALEALPQRDTAPILVRFLTRHPVRTKDEVERRTVMAIQSGILRSACRNLCRVIESTSQRSLNESDSLSLQLLNECTAPLFHNFLSEPTSVLFDCAAAMAAVTDAAHEEDADAEVCVRVRQFLCKLRERFAAAVTDKKQAVNTARLLLVFGALGASLTNVRQLTQQALSVKQMIEAVLPSALKCSFVVVRVAAMRAAMLLFGKEPRMLGSPSAAKMVANWVALPSQNLPFTSAAIAALRKFLSCTLRHEKNTKKAKTGKIVQGISSGAVRACVVSFNSKHCLDRKLSATSRKNALICLRLATQMGTMHPQVVVPPAIALLADERVSETARSFLLWLQQKYEAHLVGGVRPALISAFALLTGGKSESETDGGRTEAKGEDIPVRCLAMLTPVVQLQEATAKRRQQVARNVVMTLMAVFRVATTNHFDDNDTEMQRLRLLDATQCFLFVAQVVAATQWTHEQPYVLVDALHAPTRAFLCEEEGSSLALKAVLCKLRCFLCRAYHVPIDRRPSNVTAKMRATRVEEPAMFRKFVTSLRSLDLDDSAAFVESAREEAEQTKAKGNPTKGANAAKSKTKTTRRKRRRRNVYDEDDDEDEGEDEIMFDHAESDENEIADGSSSDSDDDVDLRS